MARSILGTLSLALTLAFAIPVAYLGVEFLLDGRTNQGLLFLALAALMVGIQEYVTTPMDLPGEIAGKVLGTAVKEPGDADEGESADAESAAPPEPAGDSETTGTVDEELIPDAEGNDR